MEGTLKSKIIDAFGNEFERRCLYLLNDAYSSIQSAHCIYINIKCREEYISAVLFDCVGKSWQAAKWHIDVNPEYLEYKDNILKQKQTDRIAPKINLKFVEWTNSANLGYFVETQSVIKSPVNYRRGKVKKTIVISECHVSYIEKIDVCLSDKYPVMGCIICYILQGNAQYTVNCLNHYLRRCGRTPEILNKRPQLKEFDACYVSVHSDRTIQHLIFDFK